MSETLRCWEGSDPEAWARRLDVATVELWDRIGSTNDRGRLLAGEPSRLPAVVVAERQSAGRGRRGRIWDSDTSDGLWVTFVTGGFGAAGVLPLRVGLVVSRAVESLAPAISVQVKWPNDLLVGGRKLGGVLCEQALGAVLTGVGVNLHQSDESLADGPGSGAVSVEGAGGGRVERGDLLGRVARGLAPVWASGDGAIPDEELVELNERSPLYGARLSIEGVVRHSSGELQTLGAVEVRAWGICADGSLEVETDDGNRVHVIAGSIGSLDGRTPAGEESP